MHLHPVRAKVVERPEEYPWASYGFFLEGKRGSIVDAMLAAKSFDHRLTWDSGKERLDRDD